MDMKLLQQLLPNLRAQIAPSMAPPQLSMQPQHSQLAQLLGFLQQRMGSRQVPPGFQNALAMNPNLLANPGAPPRVAGFQPNSAPIPGSPTTFKLPSVAQFRSPGAMGSAPIPGSPTTFAAPPAPSRVPGNQNPFGG